VIGVYGKGLTIADIAAVAGGAKIKLADDEKILRRIDESCNYLGGRLA
jgi:hypothetical protein